MTPDEWLMKEYEKTAQLRHHGFNYNTAGTLFVKDFFSLYKEEHDDIGCYVCNPFIDTEEEYDGGKIFRCIPLHLREGMIYL